MCWLGTRSSVFKYNSAPFQRLVTCTGLTCNISAFSEVEIASYSAEDSVVIVVNAAWYLLGIRRRSGIAFLHLSSHTGGTSASPKGTKCAYYSCLPRDSVCTHLKLSSGTYGKIMAQSKEILFVIKPPQKHLKCMMSFPSQALFSYQTSHYPLIELLARSTIDPRIQECSI